MTKTKNKVCCEICRLKTSRIGDEKRIFMAKFPLDEARCRKWVAATGNEDLIHLPIEKLHQLKYICGQHFRPRDFKKKKTQLRKTAVPSINISLNPLTDELMKDFPLHLQQITLSTDHEYSLREASSPPQESISKEQQNNENIASSSKSSATTNKPVNLKYRSRKKIYLKIKLRRIPNYEEIKSEDEDYFSGEEPYF
ncbi:unnamed protein product [Leptidea sinapis]|uniref:THAP-type domain-containing protein n=1 Tax=Leptidea sinapis TaxID=189913 RepID=A0A5E4R2K4_9NEOP|nr:unnamed protein product [Leptidea sinapis]